MEHRNPAGLHSSVQTPASATTPAAQTGQSAPAPKAAGLLPSDNAKRTPPTRAQNPNFLSVDEFCKRMRAAGFNLSHDYVVRCIKEKVISNQAPPSLLPTTARKSPSYSIPVAEVDRISAELRKLEQHGANEAQAEAKVEASKPHTGQTAQ